MAEGQRVEFTVTQGQKGPQAEDVNEVEIEALGLRIGEPHEYIEAVKTLQSIRDELTLVTEEMASTFSKGDELFNSLKSDIERMDLFKEIAQ